MEYKIIFDKDARKFFNKLDDFTKRTISKKIDSLKTNPHLGKPLTVNLAGYWSLRIGEHRIIYTIRERELIILVLKIGKRKNVY